MDGARVYKVTPGSPADQAGVVAGDRLWGMGGLPAGDIIDYKIWESDEKLFLLIQTGSGPLRRTIVRKPCNEPLGVQFAPPTIAPLIRCRNRCLFCFVDQNPPGMRDSLYFKDDDYRLSFLYGNYITLNHLTARELRRIKKLRLSPLYVSVHSTDPNLRCRLYRNRQASRGLDNLEYLIGAGIEIHTQIVVCPNYNLGADLLKTVIDLESMGEAMLSVAVVPVGLTSYGAPPAMLRRLTAAEACEVVGQIRRLQIEFLNKRGSRFVFLADEFYRLARIPYPKTEHYEGFPQLENGVGMARLFLDELAEMENLLPAACPRRFKITLATGTEAAHLVKQLLDKLTFIDHLEAELIVIENRFFGSTVTVTGLLTGKDLKDGLQNIVLGEAVFFSAEMLTDGGSLFLDGSTLGQLGRFLHTSLIPVTGPVHFARELSRLISSITDSPNYSRQQGGR